MLDQIGEEKLVAVESLDHQQPVAQWPSFT